MKSSDRIKKLFTQQSLIKQVMNPSTPDQQKLFYFQMALSMVGITASVMSCELIAALANRLNERGKDFTLGEAEAIVKSIQMKYQAREMPHPVHVPLEHQDQPQANDQPDQKDSFENDLKINKEEN